MFKKYNFRYYNFILLFLVISLMILGVFVIDSVNDDFTVKQAAGVGLAIVIMRNQPQMLLNDLQESSQIRQIQMVLAKTVAM